ncbi:MAG: rhodanese-like domain-containing protein [Deltaproteobacteria bacterium]|nr:rhodanese-like domain-containing protein [Deltaproteobacteria bacterium]
MDTAASQDASHEKPGQPRSWLAVLFDGFGTALRDAAIVSAVFAAIGVLVVLCFHPEGIPFIAEEAYEILVPCPEPGGEVTALGASDPALMEPTTFVVDARSEQACAQWRFREAMCVTYDYLDPTPDEVVMDVARRIAASRAQRVAVYGDGDDPDTGEQLGKELSYKGIKNVCFVKGGAPALRARPDAPGGEARP